jgi:Ca-activated chloride channel family protein
MSDMNFANPEFLYLLIVLPFLIAWYILKYRMKYPALKVSTLKGFSGTTPTLRQRLFFMPFALRMLILALLIIALARPQTTSRSSEVKTEGVDIVLTLDVSTSMLAEDLKPNRIEAAKKYAMEFIDRRIDDRIGLVIFSGESFTQCPITIDHDILKNLFEDVESGMIQDGTAIGMGLATAVNRLKDSKAKSKVVILLTDGVNNAGFVAPGTAAEIAKTFGVRVYTIGVGTKGMAPYPFQTPFGVQYRNIDVQIDEGVLKEIADITNGKYFRATNNKSLEDIYSEIDEMEKTKIDETIFSTYHEEFFAYALAAGILFVIEMLLRYLVFKRIP